MASLNDTITVERLRALLRYDPDTGMFRWLPRHPPPVASWNSRYVGKVAGREQAPRVGRPAYRKIRVDSREHKAHRLAWVYMTGRWPRADIDHVDGDPLNNRFGNLREATRRQNLRNARGHADAAVGLKGVSRSGKGGFRAEIRIGGKNRHLGSFSTPEAAHAAYAEAAREAFGEFANAG